MSSQQFICDSKNERLSIFPIKYNDIWQYYIKARSSFWIPQEVDLTTDLTDWNEKLTNDEKHFISYVLAFFSNSDFIVNENLASNFSSTITIPEIKFFYNFQCMMEDIHSEMYSQLIDVYIKDETLKTTLLNSVEQVPVIKKKADWAKKWIKEGNFVHRLIAFTIVEGIFFSGSFCAIFWLKKRGLMHGLTISNEFISRDEGLHRDFGCFLYKNYIEDKLEEKELIDIVNEAVKIEQEFITESLPVSLIGMNSSLMSQYIEYVADHLLVSLGLSRHYYTENPFDWMTLISLQGKTNFFEHRVSSYAKMTTQEDNQFKILDEF